MKIEFIMAQFDGRAAQFDPSYGSFKKSFPEARWTLYTDKYTDAPEEFSINVMDPPFDREHPRYGWRCNDYYKVKGLLDSTADVAIAVDNDMLVVDQVKVRSLLYLAERFGLLVPANARHLVEVDNTIGADSDGVLEAMGCGYAVNMSPIVYSKESRAATKTLLEYAKIMVESPVRGPTAMWRAMWNTSFAAYTLPPQFCVCEKDIGCGHEIVLHVGHESVKKHYKV